MSTPAQQVAQDFLDALWPEIPEGTSILIWTMPDRRSHWFTNTAAAAAAAILLASAHDVYTMVSLQASGLAADQRGSAEEVRALCGLWMDIDVAGDGHSSKKYPPTIDAAREILYADTLPAPTYVNHTGGGVHAWWLFPEPWLLDNPEERRQAARLAEEWQILIRRRAQSLGYTADSTHDLARVLRVPGTTNRKLAKQKIIRPVIVLDKTEVRLNPSDFRELLDEAKASADLAEDPSGPKVSSSKGNAVEMPGPSATDAGWSLRDGATVAAIDLRALDKRFPNLFLDTWNGERKDFASGKDSESEHQMALANYAALMGWPDQRIIDLLIHHRRIRTKQGPKHYKYYKKTLDAARDWANSQGQDASERARQSAQTKQSGQAKGKEANSSGAQTEAEAKRDMAAKEISRTIGCKFLRLIQIGRDDPHYRLETELGTVLIPSTAELFNQHSFRALLAAAVNRVLPHKKQAEWIEFTTLLMAGIAHESADPESERAGQTIRWLTDYLQDVEVLESWDDTRNLRGRERPDAPHKHQGAIWVNGKDFIQWVNKNMNEGLNPKKLEQRMKAITSTLVVRPIRKPLSKVSFWRLPTEDFDPNDYPLQPEDYGSREELEKKPEGSPDANEYVV